MHFQSEHDDINTISVIKYHEDAPIAHPLTLQEGTELLVRRVTKLYCKQEYLKRFAQTIKDAEARARASHRWELEYDEPNCDDLIEMMNNAYRYEADHLSRHPLDSEGSWMHFN